MSKAKAKNEKMKRKYFDWLAGAEGYSEKTLDAIEKAIWKYEEFTKDADFAEFNSKIAQQFKKHLGTRPNTRSGGTLSLPTQYHTLRHVNSFFMWLSGQSGYKSKIKPLDVRYLRLTKEESRKATSPAHPKYPTLSHIKKLCAFEIETEIDRRDRAMIAFAALSGMRDLAIISLPLGCFDPNTLHVEQDPKFGVQTKFSKHITTVLFRFDQQLLGYVLEWERYLREQKLFTDADPLFPATNVELKSETEHAFTAKGVEAKFWASAGTMRKVFQDRARQQELEYFSPHKFRHFAISEAQKYAHSAEELKAVSQNVGHENLGTTFFGYGHMDTFRVKDVIGGMNFQKKTSTAKPTKQELIDLINNSDLT